MGDGYITDKYGPDYAFMVAHDQWARPKTVPVPHFEKCGWDDCEKLHILVRNWTGRVVQWH